MADRTAERLTAALILAGAPPRMVALARAGHYDDYLSDHPFPISQLVADALAAGLDSIATRAAAGEFDGTKEEADRWFRSVGGLEGLFAQE